MKKEWKKPRLVIVARSSSSTEENVMAACKHTYISGPNIIQTYCYLENVCTLCQSFANS
jgi:hypothetical protein